MRRCHSARMWQIAHAHRLLILVQTLCSTCRLRTTGTAKSHSVQALFLGTSATKCCWSAPFASPRVCRHAIPRQAPRAAGGWGSQDFQTVPTWRWQSGQLYAPATFTPQERSPVLISVRGWVDPWAIVWLEGLSQLKIFKHSAGNRTHHLASCSAVPQRTASPRTPVCRHTELRKSHYQADPLDTLTAL